MKLGQQAQDASKKQQDGILARQQTQQTIGNIASNNGVNAQELEHILRNLMNEVGLNSEPVFERRDGDRRDENNDMDTSSGNGNGNGSASDPSNPTPYDREGHYANEPRRIVAAHPDWCGRPHRSHDA